VARIRLTKKVAGFRRSHAEGTQWRSETSHGYLYKFSLLCRILLHSAMATFLNHYDMYMSESSRNVFRYPSTDTNGFFRLVLIDPLLRGPNAAAIHVKQFYLYDSFDRVSLPPYVAISHVWNSSDEALKAAQAANRPLHVQVEENELRDISWHGLQQAASIAKYLGYEYLWLDFLCLNQLSSADKKLQIKNMGNIYRCAAAVLIMVGGIQAAHDLHSGAEWMDRAWTLQEATLCKETFAVFQWEHEGHGLLVKDQDRCWVRKMQGNVGYARLLDLLPMVGKPPVLKVVSEFGVVEESEDSESDDTASDTESEGSEIDFKSAWGEFKSGIQEVVQEAVEDVAEEAANDIFEPFVSDIANEGFERIECFNFSSQAGQLLRDIIYSTNEATRITAIWNAIWLRTSTKEQDIVFGSMHLFRVNIEVDYNRTLDDLIFDLASRTSNFPGWLTLGSFKYHHPSGLVPLPPPFESNSTFEYGVLSPARKYVRSRTYLDFDIRILELSHHHGQLFCARLLQLRPKGEIKSLSLRKNCTRLIFGAKRGSYKHKSQVVLIGPNGHELETECLFDGDLGWYVVVVGHPHEMDRPLMDTSKTFVFFLGYSNGRWERIGAGEIAISYELIRQNTIRSHCRLYQGSLLASSCNC